MNDIARYWDWLIDNGIATEAELQLITSINGYNIDTLNDVLYVRTGYRDYEQYTGADELDDDEADEANE